MNNSKKEKNQHINVFVRVRPLNKQEGLTDVIEIKSPKEMCIKHHSTAKSYTFDRVFGPDSRQIELYKLVAEPTVAEVINGYNCTVLAYGQTGTGKTYTMAGGAVANVDSAGMKTPWFEDVHSGIIPRTLAHMFDELRMQQLDYTVRVSYLELYNEEIFDLLSPVDDTTKLKLYDDSLKKGSVIVHGLTESNVNTKSEVYRILEKGAEKRRIASTLMNAQSSRSHTVFCITVHTKENSVDGEDLLKTGKLYLVDLAGSENIKQSGATELRAREAFSINQSLLTLGRCIVKLTERSTHIPYRESKLTRLLQDSLGGRTKTTLIATVSPAFCNADETLNTLDYACRAKRITNKPEVNQRLSKTALLKEYTEEIERLRKDLNASRMGRGIYLDKDNYDLLVKERDLQKDEIADKIGMIRVLQDEMERKEQACNHLQMSLEKHQKEVETKVIVIETLENKLEEASKEINNLSEENEIKEYIVTKHCETEQALQVTAKKLLNVAEVTTADTKKLHDKLDVVLELNKQNKVICEQYITDFNSKILVIEDKLREFHDRENSFHDSMSNLLELLEKMNSSYKNQSSHLVGQFQSVLNQTTGLRTNSKIELSRFEHDIKHVNKTVKATIASNEQAVISRLKTDLMPQINEHTELMTNYKHLIDLTCRSFRNTLIDNKQNVTVFLETLKHDVDAAKKNTCLFINARKSTINLFQNELVDSLKSQKKEQQEIETKFDAALSLVNEAKSMSLDYIRRGMTQHQRTIENYESVTDTLTVAQEHLSLLSSETSKIANDFYMSTNDFTNNQSKKLNLSNVKLFNEGERVNENLGKLVEVAEETAGFFEDANNSIRNSVNLNCDLLSKSYLDKISDRKQKYNALEQQTEVMRKDFVAASTQLTSCMNGQVEKMTNELNNHDMYCTQHESHVSTELEHCREGFKKLFSGSIKEYKQTGVTPVRKRYRYPRSVVETKPHELLVEEFHHFRSHSGSRVNLTIQDVENLLAWEPGTQPFVRSASENDIQKSIVDFDGNRTDPLAENGIKEDLCSLIPRPGENHYFGNVKH